MPDLDYPWPEAQAPGEIRQVAHGIHWLRLKLPLALDHVNVWLLEDGEDWTVVDTGLSDEATKAVWETVLADRRVTRLIITHFHPDHAGLAGWLQAKTGAEFWMSRTEWLMARMLLLDPEPDAREDMDHYLQRLGFGPDTTWDTIYQGRTYGTMTGMMPRLFQRLHEAQPLRIGGQVWRVIRGAGHSPEMACLYCEALGVLIAGDQVLPRISPNIGVNAAEMAGNPLQRFLETLDVFRQFPADTLVLPSHNEPFRGLHDRLDALTAHHQDRLAVLLEACASPRTIADLTKFMFRRPLVGFNVMLGAAETLAHVNLLYHRGLVTRSEPTDRGFFFAAA